MSQRRRKVSTTQSQPAGSNVIDPGQQPAGSNVVANQPREITERPASSFDVREGDRLTVIYSGVKLGIAPYSTVELDSSIYSRTLHIGDDPVEQWDLVYNYLKEQCLKVAREKLRVFSEELRKSKTAATPTPNNQQRGF